MAATILVPLDSSRFGEHALPVAVGIARRTGARVHVVHCHEPPLPPMYPVSGAPYDAQLDRTLREQEAAYLARVADRVLQTCGVAVRTDLLNAPTVPTLVSYATDAEVDLIVMTTHGRGGISRAWLGSVADALVRRTSVPVLLLRPRDEDVVMTCEPQTSHMLIPLDGSDLSEGILSPALALAQLSGARITLLQVMAPQPVDSDARSERRAAQRYLESVARRVAADIEIDIAVETHASPAVAILEYAGLHGADLIALATHGRGGWSRVTLGSVADKVVRGTMMPVLLYRPPAAGTRALETAGGIAEMIKG
ncbi:MAG TPA: universal stress protein [Longimicrobiales bacterium]|nr:universal stress protein [Longimicrobiales bacterium]